MMVTALLGVRAAQAADPVRLVLQDNRFTPSEVRVKAGERIRIEVRNAGSAPAEFESSELKIEKVVVAGGTIVVSAGPLKPGTYRFSDEYHPEATGTIIAVENLAEK